MNQMQRVVCLACLALALEGAVACALKGAGASGATAAGNPGAVAPVAAKMRRVTQLVRDAGVGKQETIATYWTYGSDAPFQVTSLTSKGTAPAANRATTYGLHTTVSASVRLFDAAKRAYRIQQAASQGNGAASASAALVAPSLDAGGLGIPLPDESIVVGGEVDTTTNPPSNQASVIDPNADSPGEAGADPSFPPLSAASPDLSAPHDVSVEGDIPYAMSNANVELTFTDKVTGETLDVSHDQLFQKFSFKSTNGTASFEITPDGTYLVDGKGATSVKDAIALLKLSPVIEGTSRYILGMIVARIGRTAPTPSRSPVNCAGANQRVYRVLGVLADDQARAYVLADAFLKDALKTSTLAPAR